MTDLERRLIHYSSKPLGKVHSVRTQQDEHFKPRGLWFSLEGDDDWPSWCEAEGFHLHRLACASEVVLSKEANLLWLSSAADIDSFTAEYGWAPEYINVSRIFVRWSRVAAAYQGMVIAPYIWERRLDHGASWYYAWDCASGCIWDARAIAHIVPMLAAPSQEKPEEQSADL